MPTDEYSDEYKKRLAVERAIVSSFSDINNKFLDWPTLKMRMTTIIPDTAILESWFSEIRHWRARVGSERPIFEFPQYDLLRDDLLINLNAKLNDCDNMTKIACMNWEDRAMHQWDDFNPDIFIKPFLEGNGRLYHVWGVMDSGKTDISLKLAEFLLQRNFIVITNVHCKDSMLIKFQLQYKPSNSEGEYEPIPNLYRCIYMSDLLLRCLIWQLEGKNIVMIFDEAGIFYSKKEAMTRGNIDMEKFIRLIRKFNLNIIFIEQRELGLPPTAQEMLAAEIEKLSKKRAHFNTRYLDRNYNEWIESVPRTTLKFLTKDIAGFVQDVNFTDLFNKVAVEEESEAKLHEIKQYLETIVIKNKGAYNAR